MVDFVEIKTSKSKKGDIVVSPEFIISSSSDLMVRGASFYSVWNEKKGLWSRDEYDIVRMIDGMVKEETKTINDQFPNIDANCVLLRNKSTKKWDEWCTYVKHLPNNYHDLDEKIIFSNMDVTKEDYASRKLPYPLLEGPIKSYDELMNTLYDKTERDKLEWAIGAIISGDSKKIQKFIVLYGEAGSGKSTVLNIIQQLFEGYYSVFEAKALASANNAFSLEAFKTNPLVAIQHDGDLSRIEDNTKLNSIVSHEVMLVNEKNKPQYPMRFNSFLFMGTNKPVKITEAKSGIIRRLIDVSPSGRKIPFERYQALMNQIKFELGGIAYHCLSRYLRMGENYYDKYKPTAMIGATNDFYNFIEDNYDLFNDKDGVPLEVAWNEYKKYFTEAGLSYMMSRRIFKEELKNYFREVRERYLGKRKVYLGFKKEKFNYISLEKKEKEESAEGCQFSLKLENTESLFDKTYGDCLAQYSKKDESPDIAWTNVKTKLKDLDTTKLHYVLVPEDLIVIDFDLKDKDGNKDPVANLIAASMWPPTYAEYSKSGGGIHLHYIYEGDVLTLSRIVEPGIEVKVFKKIDGTRGYASLRRKLSKCNDIPIAKINSGLPLKKGADDVVSFEGLKNEKAIRTLIMRALNKEYHGFTAPNVDLIFKTLEDAYNNGVVYDVTDLRNAVLTFATKSSNQASRCIDLVAKMHFKSKEDFKAAPDDEYDKVWNDIFKDGPDGTDNGAIVKASEEAPIALFDVEVFPNLLLICWKYLGTPRESVTKMFNPTPDDVKKLFSYRLVGFNNRKYDNHILYAASLGYSNKKIYEISKGIVSSDRGDDSRKYMFGAAYNLSYADIYDYSSKKQSLKKWEIAMGIHHQELGLPWDEEVDPALWDKVADYCVNDVMATEALYLNLTMDLETRKLLASLSGLSVNDPNRLHITRILVGDDKNPPHVYTNLADIFPGYEYVIDDSHKAHNMYRGVDVGFGGYVYSEPGMYKNVALLDVGNMHGASIIALNKFGPYTKNYEEIRSARMAIKAGRFNEAKSMLDGKLIGLIEDIEKLPEGSDERQAAVDGLQGALKLILNSTYGIAAAKFKNPLHDDRDINNIIALRGALFMKTLQDEVVKKGFQVVHIKTDSIKIPDATDDIVEFVIDFGRKYGYEFEHEATYQKMCLVNDAVYIAKYDEMGIRNKHGKHAGEWTATGAQFAQPYVFKALFSKEPIEHKDVCETKETSKGLGLYLDMNEGLPEGEHDYHFIGRVGQFCPILPGCGGGILVREKDGKYDAVTGTKKASYDKASGEEPTYRWLESELVENLNKWDDVDLSYYRHLVDEAVNDISEYGDFEWFTSDDPVSKPEQRTNNIVGDDFMNVPETEEEELPFL